MGTRETAWSEVSERLAAIVADLDAVVRAHVGGPVLRFEILSRGTARLVVGRTRLRLSLEPWRGPALDALAFPSTALVLIARAERGDGSLRRLVLWLDPVGLRWASPDDPFVSRSFDDRDALEVSLFTILADARENGPDGSSSPVDEDTPAVWPIQERASSGSSAGIMPRWTTCPRSVVRGAAQRG